MKKSKMKLFCMGVAAMAFAVVAFGEKSQGDTRRSSPSNGVVNITPKGGLFTLKGPYGIYLTADPGCEKGAKYELRKLIEIYLPRAKEFYGDPFGGKSSGRVFRIDVVRNDGDIYPGSFGAAGFGGAQPGSFGSAGNCFRQRRDSWCIGLAKGSDWSEMSLDKLAAAVLTFCEEPSWMWYGDYVNRLVNDKIKGVDSDRLFKDSLQRQLESSGINGWYRLRLSLWIALEELRAKRQTLILDYCNLKNKRFAAGKLPKTLSFEQVLSLLEEVSSGNATELFNKLRDEEKKLREPFSKPSANDMRRDSDRPPQKKIKVSEKLQECDFLLNGDFKRNAKIYLCLFSASWCGPCRHEMPRIAKTYAETLKDDPDVELIHFSCDRDDQKALAWAKEHGVKFPVVKPQGGNPLGQGGNPLGLSCGGIPHLFILKADGTRVEDGHPVKLFTEERLKALIHPDSRP